MLSDIQAKAIPDIEESLKLLQVLPTMKIAERRTAINRLARNPSPYVRQRALQMGSVLLSEEHLVEFLRNEADDVARNIGLEMLKLRGQKTFSLIVHLLKDKDPDVVLQAILILDSMRTPRALEPLRAILLSTNDLNLVQTAIVAIGHIGDERVIPDLTRYLDEDPWLQMAAIAAMGELRSRKSIPVLKKYLKVPLLETIAAEALARIGGKTVFTCLAGHWLDNGESLDAEFVMGLLVYVAEGLSSQCPNVCGLSDRAAEQLKSSNSKLRSFSARLLLALNIENCFGPAVKVLEDSNDLPERLPVCLKNNHRLLVWLLEAKDPLYGWGIELAELNIDKLENIEMTLLLTNTSAEDHIGHIVTICSKCTKQNLAPLLLNLWITLSPSSRPNLNPVLLKHREVILAELGKATDIDASVKAMLHLLLKSYSAATAAEILMSLPEHCLSEAVEHLKNRPECLRLLPWKDWLEKGMNIYAHAAGIAATKGGLRELSPLLRNALLQTGNPDIIRTLGVLGDAENIDAISSFTVCPNSLLRVLALETLGEIGGQRARKEIMRALPLIEEREKRIAYRSFARCACAGDKEIFAKLAVHQDWIVRLACAEYFERFPEPQALSYIYALASDPVQVVANKASAVLEQNEGFLI
jgi:HEAT repeat protein